MPHTPTDETARPRRKPAPLPRSLRRLHDRLRALPPLQALDLLAEARTGLTTPEDRLNALRLRLRLISGALDGSAPLPAKPKRSRKPAAPKAAPPEIPEPPPAPAPKAPAPAPRPRAATFNTLDPSDPSIFGMLDALATDDPAPATPGPAAPEPTAAAPDHDAGPGEAPTASPAPEDPFALLAAFDTPGDDTDTPAEDPFALLATLGSTADEPSTDGPEDKTPPTTPEDPFALLAAFDTPEDDTANPAEDPFALLATLGSTDDEPGTDGPEDKDGQPTPPP